MSETKHTPAPWRVEDQHVEDSGQFEEARIWAGDKHVAVIRVGLAGSDANAHLIAAAPEMYEALKEMLTAIEMEGANGLRFFEARNSGLAALLKAEGKAVQVVK